MTNNRQLTDRERAVFARVWRALAPELPVQEFLDRVSRYDLQSSRLVRPISHETRTFTAEEAALLPDNSADFERMNYVYHGVEAIESLVQQKAPVAFFTWHHGGNLHVNYAVTRLFPETGIFTRKTFQVGKHLTIPMAKFGNLSLAKMRRLLKTGCPILYYLDGVPLGRLLTVPMFGLDLKLSAAPFQVVRQIQGVRVVPVATFYRDPNTVDVTFIRSSLTPDRLLETTDKTAMTIVVGELEKHLKENAQEQVRWQWLTFRGHRARVLREEQQRNRNS